MPRELYLSLAIALVALHFLFNLSVVFGAALTRQRPRLAIGHIISVVYAAIIQNASWPCPLTVAEVWCETRAGGPGYQGSFLLHYLETLVYPDIPLWVLRLATIAVCLVNLAVYAHRYAHRQARPV